MSVAPAYDILFASLCRPRTRRVCSVVSVHPDTWEDSAKGIDGEAMCYAA